MESVVTPPCGVHYPAQSAGATAESIDGICSHAALRRALPGAEHQGHRASRIGGPRRYVEEPNFLTSPHSYRLSLHV